MHARQTQALSELVREELAREQAQQSQAPLPPEPIRIQPPAAPEIQAPEPPRSHLPEPAPPQGAAMTNPSRWRQILARLRPRRIPVLLQLSAVECGAACLAMILSYYGRITTIADVRERCQVGRDGLSALDIVKAARSYGLRVRAVSLQEDDLSLITCPPLSIGSSTIFWLSSAPLLPGWRW